MSILATRVRCGCYPSGQSKRGCHVCCMDRTLAPPHPTAKRIRPCQDHSMGRTVAFVLGGGGILGAVEVGMIRALYDAGIHPDVIVGTSIGALNGVVLAAAPPEET